MTTNIKKIVYCSDEQYETLVKEGKAIINGVEKQYEPETTLYITPATGSYPVGAIYMSVVSTSPASIFGGTWEKIEDKYLVGKGGLYNGEGGSREHLHGAGNLGAMVTVQTASNSILLRTEQTNPITTYTPNKKITATAVEDYSYSTDWEVPILGQTSSAYNDPPYLAVNIWKRIA